MKHRDCPTLLLPAVLIAALAAGQNAAPQASGIDITGSWNAAGGGGAENELVDYAGEPLNEAGRLYALTWNPTMMTTRQQQCAGYEPIRLIERGSRRFWEVRDPYTQKLISIGMYGQITEGTRTIWMDGRPHPPAYAKHSFLGFATGKYEGNVLTVHTTHMKRNWIRTPNGVPFSDQATLIEHFIRHGDRLTYVAALTDPVYFTEPLVTTADMVRATRDPDAWLYACDDGEQLLDQQPDKVPNYLFGQNPYLREHAELHHLPLLAVLGGAETMYPEILGKMKTATDVQALALTRPSSGPMETGRAVDPNPRDGDVHVWPVQGGVYMLIGDDANIAVQVGDQGALVVDTGTGKLADKVIAAIRGLVGDKPIQFIVNTSFHADHTGGNVKVRAAGADPSVLGSFFDSNFNGFKDAGVGSTIIAHQNVLNRMSAPTGKVAPTPSDGWPSDTFLKGRRRKYYNNEAVEVFWEPNAITDGDSIVQFRRSDVIVTGDILTTTQYPFIDLNNGGSVQGEIAALNNILDHTVYKHLGDDGTLIIPGHGRVCDEYEVAEYRDMLAIIRDRVQAMIKQGATLEQVRAARVTVDYDPRYGSNSGPWTTNMFVEAVYNSLKQGPAKATGQR
jgi:glyoxylase-like metal-dependent hydrolase (beta-lactamase superfamily II)